MFAWSTVKESPARRTTKLHQHLLPVAQTHEIDDALEDNSDEGPNLSTVDRLGVAVEPDADISCTDAPVDAVSEGVGECQGGCRINTDLIIENMQLKEELNKLKHEQKEKLVANDSTPLFGVEMFKSDAAKWLTTQDFQTMKFS